MSSQDGFKLFANYLPVFENGIMGLGFNWFIIDLDTVPFITNNFSMAPDTWIAFVMLGNMTFTMTFVLT